MIFNWTYLLILQFLVVLTYYFKRKDIEEHPFSKLFPTKVHFTVSNASIFFVCYLYNTERQLFCNPVPWTSVLLILFFISFLSYPFLKDIKIVSSILLLFSGLGIFISVYLILFARWEYLVFLAFNIPVILIFHFGIKLLKKKYKSNVFEAFYFYPAVILTPFILLYQLWLELNTLTNIQKKVFVLVPVLTFATMILLSFRVNHLVNEIKVSQNDISELMMFKENSVDNYLIELILGAHWKYHTELCLYDGWRPPFHDPVLVSANKILNPTSKFDQGTTLPNAKKLYKQLFPENSVKFDCRCAKKERLFDLN